MSLWISLREACVPITRVLLLSFVALIEQHIEVELSTRSKRAITSRKRRKILKMEWTFEFRMLLYLTHEVAICNTSIILLQLITNDPSFSKFFDFWVSVYSLVTSQGTCLVDRLNLDISNAIYAICRDIWWGKSTAEMVSLWRSCCVCLDHTHQSVTLSSVPLFWNLIMDAECGPERSFCCLSALRILKIQLGQTEKLIKFWTDGRTDRIRILWAFRVKFGKSFQYFRWFFMCFTFGFWFHTFYFFISHFSRYRRMYTCICKVHGLKATCLDMALCLCTSTEILNTVWFLSEYANTLST